MRFFGILMASVLLATPGFAQVPPRAAELEAYKIHHPEQTDIRLPGAARWRYLPTDAGDWIGCPAGCCTIK